MTPTTSPIFAWRRMTSNGVWAMISTLSAVSAFIFASVIPLKKSQMYSRSA